MNKSAPSFGRIAAMVVFALSCFSGTGPPNASHRNSSRPKHDSAKTTITRTREKEGVEVCISPSSSCS